MFQPASTANNHKARRGTPLPPATERLGWARNPPTSPRPFRPIFNEQAPAAQGTATLNRDSTSAGRPRASSCPLLPTAAVEEKEQECSDANQPLPPVQGSVPLDRNSSSERVVAVLLPSVAPRGRPRSSSCVPLGTSIPDSPTDSAAEDSASDASSQDSVEIITSPVKQLLSFDNRLQIQIVGDRCEVLRDQVDFTAKCYRSLGERSHSFSMRLRYCQEVRGSAPPALVEHFVLGQGRPVLPTIAGLNSVVQPLERAEAAVDNASRAQTDADAATLVEEAQRQFDTATAGLQGIRQTLETVHRCVETMEEVRAATEDPFRQAESIGNASRRRGQRLTWLEALPAMCFGG
ncbi:uncharacterized protein LTR77_005255 [Saxophila tyrrhenica]|uniref:Uncharacterized protein n=1 Tax=Saxophila tyrrhenica TaxID=1690608 RepID=A0AAV9PC62_9PEZI|nr:hypothetical protein LTR77_005255 [Saxophila tyrrhenica]